jgi:hypothetical protein
MNSVKATTPFEKSLARHVAVVKADLAKKHRMMDDSPLVFLPAAYYRWAQVWGAGADSPRPEESQGQVVARGR